MSDRDFQLKMATAGRNRIAINFSFRTNGTSDPNTRFFQGNSDVVSSIVQVGTGAYKVTLSARDKYYQCVGADASLEDSGTGVQQIATIGGFTNEGTTNGITFNVYTYGYPFNVTNVTNTRVWVDLVFRNTASTGPGDP